MFRKSAWFLVITIFLIWIPLTPAQGIPPRVIAVNPPDYVEAAPTQPFILSFDQPMDEASVEAALTFSPEITGEFTWLDEQTLTFTPEGGWARGITYTVALAATAKSKEGITLESAMNFILKAGGTLHVALVTPEADAQNVAVRDARILVAFDRPVIPLGSQLDADSLPVPLMIKPEPQGQGEWLNTSVYMFTVSGSLATNRQYTVTIQAGLTAVDGSILDETVVSTFHTEPPRVVEILPSQTFLETDTLLLDTNFTVVFDEAVNKPAIERALRIHTADGVEIAGTLQWSGSTRLTFNPVDRLDHGTEYYVSLPAEAENKPLLSQDYSQRFVTVDAPAIVSMSPEQGTVMSSLSSVWIYFNTLLDSTTIEGNFRLSPQPAGEVTWSVDPERSNLLRLQFPSVKSGDFSITLLPEIKDIYGNPIEETTLSYTVDQPVNQSVGLWVQSDFLIAATYHGNPVLPLSVGNEGQVNVYHTPLEDLATGNYGWRWYNPYYDISGRTLYRYDGETVKTPVWAVPANLVATLPSDVGSLDYFPITLDNGVPLPLGLYTVEVEPGEERPKGGVLLAMANVSVTIKDGPHGALVWVTDLETGKPVEGVQVTNWHSDGHEVLGVTDADGVVQASASTSIGYVVAEADNSYGIWHEVTYSSGYYYSYSNTTPRIGNAYVYTDRPIYRPGEIVYFRGVLRDGAYLDYSIPDGETVHVSASESSYDDYYYGETPDEPSTPIYAETVTISKFGTVSGSFVIPEDAPLSPYYSLQIKTCDDSDCEAAIYTSTNFEVAEFRVPEFEVSVTAQQEEIINGDTLNAIITSNYYYGSPVSDANLTWLILDNYTTSFNYTGKERGYRFSNVYSSRYFYNQNDENLSTDTRGQYLLGETINIENMRRPAVLTVEATVSDETGQAISSRDRFLVHPAEVYVGMRSSAIFGSSSIPYNIALLTVGTDSTHIPDHTVVLDIIKITYERDSGNGYYSGYRRIETPLETDIEVITGDDGKATYVFEAPDAGTYEIRARTYDRKGRANYSQLTVYASNLRVGRQYDWLDPYVYNGVGCGGYSPEPLKLRLVRDADFYNPGETAHILIPNPYDEPVTALITIERAGIMDVETVTIEGDTYTYDLLLTDEHAPNAYVAVVLMRGAATVDDNPASIRGEVSITVDPSVYRLNIGLTPSSETVKPGETLSFDVLLTDREGEPVQGEVGLALTDEAIFALRPENSGLMETRFYGHQGLAVSTNVGLRGLLSLPIPPAPDGGCGGGGDGEAAPESPAVRDDFVYTPLWEPHVVTDESGKATVSLEMPDNLTRWRLDARAVTTDTRVGQNRITVNSRLPLMVRPVTPRFFVAGDRMPVAAVVNNNTDEIQVVEVRLESTGLQVEGEMAQTVTINPQGRARVEWNTVVEDVAGIDVTMFAVAESGLGDAAKPTLTTNPDGTIPVYRFTAPETVSTGGVLEQASTTLEGVSLPRQVSEVGGELVLQFNPSLAGVTLNSLDYVRNFPHQCIEQTVSRFLPNMVTYRALREFGLENADLEANLTTALDFGMKKLISEQNSDGGWGWFGGMDSNPYVTSYALLSLIETRDAGYTIDDEMARQAASYLSGELFNEIEVNTESWVLDRQAFYVYVLLRWEDDQSLTDLMDMLHESRTEMSHSGRAFLLLAYLQTTPDHEAVDALVSDFTSTAFLSANSAHWRETEHRYWWNWDSDTRTTALALLALSKADPENPLLPAVVRWLVTARRGDHWTTTQETAWSVMALTEWMKTTGELNPDYDYTVRVNQNELVNRAVESFDQNEIVTVDVRDLVVDALNTLTITRGEGEGRLYYTSTLKLDLPASEVGAASRGVIVNREYFNDNGELMKNHEVMTGDTVTVRLNLIVTQDMYYFVLEDTLPAGLEILDPRLMTTTTTAQTRFRRVRTGDPYWYYGYYHFDRTEMRDTGANLYADYLPRGSYIFTYQARAVAPGEFQVIPAQAYAFYQPEIYGRSEGIMFTVVDQ